MQQLNVFGLRGSQSTWRESMQIQGEHSRATQKSPLILGYLKAKPHCCAVAGTINNLMPHLVDTTKDTLNFNL